MLPPRPLVNRFKWGHLTLIETYRIPFEKAPGVMDTQGPVIWKLVCDCGKALEVPEVDFPGRRIMRDCGLQCPTRAKPVRKTKERKSAYSLYLSESLAKDVSDYAHQHNLSFSRAIETLAREGLISKLINE